MNLKEIEVSRKGFRFTGDLAVSTGATLHRIYISPALLSELKVTGKVNDLHLVIAMDDNEPNIVGIRLSELGDVNGLSVKQEGKRSFLLSRDVAKKLGKGSQWRLAKDVDEISHRYTLLTRI